MEELQDAIEDAQYVNAISTQDDGPRPVLPWEIPTKEQLQEWHEKVRGLEPNAYTLEWTLQSAIGLFLFSAFLKEKCNDYLRINFCEEVIRWRKLRGGKRVEKTRKIIISYLSDTSSRPPPPKTEIDEYDLERHPKDKENLEAIFSENFEISCQQSFVGLCGSILDDILSKLESVEKAREDYKLTKASEEESPLSDGFQDQNTAALIPEEIFTDRKPMDQLNTKATILPSEASLARSSDYWSRSRASSQFRLITQSSEFGPRFIPDDFFDRAESIVMESLRRQYWEAFLESEHYNKLMHFLWYQDRSVVPEDFFVMRVLGRGGFGLVTGEFVAKI
jgi:hypothetical protein